MAYCTTSDVRLYLPRAVVIEGENPNPHVLDPRPESLTTVDLQSYIASADDQINALIGGIYNVPLKQTNIDGTVKYPDPIPFISSVMSAWMVFQQRLSGSEKASGEFTERMYKVAMSRLEYIVNGYNWLRGQDSYRSHRTINSDLFAAPPRTSKDPADFTKI